MQVRLLEWRWRRAAALRIRAENPNGQNINPRSEQLAYHVINGRRARRFTIPDSGKQRMSLTCDWLTWPQSVHWARNVLAVVAYSTSAHAGWGLRVPNELGLLSICMQARFNPESGNALEKKRPHSATLPGKSADRQAPTDYRPWDKGGCFY